MTLQILQRNQVSYLSTDFVDHLMKTLTFMCDRLYRTVFLSSFARKVISEFKVSVPHCLMIIDFYFFSCP